MHHLKTWIAQHINSTLMIMLALLLPKPALTIQVMELNWLSVIFQKYIISKLSMACVVDLMKMKLKSYITLDKLRIDTFVKLIAISLELFVLVLTLKNLQKPALY